MHILYLPEYKLHIFCYIKTNEIYLRLKIRYELYADMSNVNMHIIWTAKLPEFVPAVDAFKGHTTDIVQNTMTEKMNIDMAVIPGGMTSQLQIRDVCINKPFKDHLRQLYTNQLQMGSHFYRNHHRRLQEVLYNKHPWQEWRLYSLGQW